MIGQPAAPALHIVCPRQMRALPILVSLAGLGVLVSATARQLGRGAADVPYLSFGVVLLMGAWLCLILYRNLLFRDELVLVQSGEAPDARTFTLAAASVRAVRACPAPAPSSYDGRWEALGFGEGRIEIDTDSHRYRFGVGLDEHMVGSTVDRIAAFCGLRGH
ncbi:hypothetical protein [Massilia yuzhufengensis]|uniref:Uncharacterized protein n=1 Tax=Massilia yuzhufengensis TaxID=1164594 RepID=A0A1I1QER7_9BURK|nr:hypothetical protein [Massilia yuzhufengensis]SFD20586.1 hypothetical protein SAMN05216204_1194 [Massilia yuzhufengensis]